MSIRKEKRKSSRTSRVKQFIRASVIKFDERYEGTQERSFRLLDCTIGALVMPDIECCAYVWPRN
jgi:hypothetical protein